MAWVIFLVIGVIVFFFLLAFWFIRASGRRIREVNEKEGGFDSSVEDDDVAGSPFD